MVGRVAVGLAQQVGVAAADQHEPALLPLALEHRAGGEAVVAAQDVQRRRRGEQLGRRGRQGHAAPLEDRSAGAEVGDHRDDVPAEVGI